MKIIFVALMLICGIVSAKEWSLMVFLNADNSLNSFAQPDMDEMKMALADIDNFADITVMLDKRANNDSKYIHLNLDTDNDVVEMGEIDGGSYLEVIKFVNWSMQNYPAEKYALVIWDHGAGWDKVGYRSMFQVLNVSIDDSSGTEIKTNDLHKIFEGILPNRLNLLAYDACLMQMMEVLYEAKDYVDVVVASEETEPAAGYPYDKIFPELKAGFSAEDFGKSIVKAYMESYLNDSDITSSAVSIAKFNEFLPFFKQWAAEADVAAFKKAKSEAVSFAISSNKDLGQILAKTAKQEVIDAYNAMILANGSDMGSTGVAVYAPSWSVSSAYGKLDFIAAYPEYLQLLNK